MHLHVYGRKQLAQPGREFQVARRRILNVEQCLREAIEIVDGFRLLARRDRGTLGVPMRRYAQDGLGLRDGAAEPPPGLRVLVALERVHRAPVPEEHHRHSRILASHCGGAHARSNSRTSAPSPFSSTISEVVVAFSASPASSGWPFTVNRPRATCTSARRPGCSFWTARSLPSRIAAFRCRSWRIVTDPSRPPREETS